MQAAKSSTSDWHGIDPFFVSALHHQSTFLGAWTGLRILFLPVQKELIIVGVNWSGRNPFLIVKNKTKLNQNKEF